MHRVFISNLDQAPGRACAHVFKCFGYEVYGTVQDDDDSQPAPAECHRVIPNPNKNLTEFQQGILSCSVVIYDMLRPSETISAFEICAAAHNQRKFIAISTFMTWARTELPEAQIEEDPHKLNEDDLPDEKTMELDEVAQLYKQAKQPIPQWVIVKQEEIKRKEREEREAEARANGENLEEEKEEKEEVEGAAQPDAPAEPQQQEDEQQEAAEENHEEEPEEEEQDVEPGDPEEELLKLPTYGLVETEFITRRPHPQFREVFDAENQLVRRLDQVQNITGAIVTAGIVYGYGETVLTNLYKRFYKQIQKKSPLYYGGHSRTLPFVHALDLALLIHALVVERCPDKTQPFVFATQRQQITARQFAEVLGQRLLADDPRREEVLKQIANEKRLKKPKPLTKQTYKIWLANYDKPIPLNQFVAEVNKNDTLLSQETVLELTTNCPIQLGFAANDVLDSKWPLFARAGILENVELSWTEFLHVWGLEPVRVFVQVGPVIQRQLGMEVGQVIAKHLEKQMSNDEQLKQMIEAVGRSNTEEQATQLCNNNLLVLDCTTLTKEEVVQKTVLDKKVRNRGWVLVNLPENTTPEDLFGQPAISNFFEKYAELGLKAPKKKKKTEEEEEVPAEEEEKPEWLAEDVEIDEEQKISIIRQHILLPYTAPRNLFSFSKNGRLLLAEKPHEKIDYLDANCCLEHPLGLRVPKPQYVVDLPSVFRYEQEVDSKLQEQFNLLNEKSLALYRERSNIKQLQTRKDYVLNIKKQLIKIIQKKEEQEGDFDEEAFNWVENYNLIGLDPRYDLGYFKIPKKEGLPEEEEKQEVDENGEVIPKPPKPVNPDDFNLGIEDLSVYTKRQEEQAQRRAKRRERNQSRNQRTKYGDENVSDLEEEKSEPQVDDNGNPLRTAPKPRPFLNVPKILEVEDIPEPSVHNSGYVWNMEIVNKNPIPLLKPQTAEKNVFTHICLQILKFIGPARDFPPNKQERIIQQQQLKLQQEILRRIEEERLMREAEERRLAEERRQAELKHLRQKYIKDEERRVLELAVPLRKYISGTVLADLIDGLVETARIRPSDPVRFLGEFVMDRAVKNLTD